MQDHLIVQQLQIARLPPEAEAHRRIERLSRDHVDSRLLKIRKWLPHLLGRRLDCALGAALATIELRRRFMVGCSHLSGRHCQTKSD